MSESPPPRYGRPKIEHAVDPNDVNWLWKMIGEAAGVYPREVVIALEDSGNPLPLNRAKAWAYGEENVNRSAMNVTELVAVLQALIQHRAKERDRAKSAAKPERVGMLTEADIDKFDALLGYVLDEHAAGRIGKEDAVTEISHLVSAIDDREFEEVRQALRQRLENLGK